MPQLNSSAILFSATSSFAIRNFRTCPLWMASALVACALGDGREQIPSYRLGVRSRWWWGQIDHLVGRFRSSATSDPLPPDTRGTCRAWADLVLGLFRRADYEEVLRWTDPLPFWNETIRWIKLQREDLYSEQRRRAAIDELVAFLSERVEEDE